MQQDKQGARVGTQGACGRGRVDAGLRPGLLALLISAGWAAMAVPVAAQAQQSAVQAQRIGFDLPAQPLMAALRAFGRQTEYQVLYDEAQLGGLRSPAIQGSFTPKEAIDRLLVGTGLAADSTSPGSFTLRKLPQPSAALSEGTLAPVVVTARAERSGTTEGTTSYAQAGPSSTATKLDLSLRETPQSVTVVTRQKMDDKAYQTLDQAITDSSGMTASNGLGSTRYSYYSRGLAVDSIQYDGMSTYVSTYTRDADPADDLDLYDRVEILRGAAGLTAGAGNPSGAINLMRKRPLDVPMTRIDVGTSSFGNGKILLDASRPLNDSGTVRGRFVGSFSGGDSYIDYTSSKAGLLYGVIDADIGDRTTVSLGYSYKHEKLDGYDWTGLVVRPDGSFFDFDASTFLGNASDYSDRRQHAAYLDLEKSFNNGWRLKSSGRASWSDAVMQTGIRSYFNGEYSRGSRQFDYENNVYSLDINSAGPISLLGRSHDAVLGFNGARSAITGITRNPNLSIPFDPENWNPSTPWPLANYTPSSVSDSVNTQYGVYGQVRLNVTDSLKVFTGGRLSWYENSDTWTYPRTGQVSITEMAERAKFVPYLGVVYDLTEGTSAYASFTSIFNPQSSYYGVSGPLAPVKGTNFELGIKQGFFDGRLTGSLAIFETNRDNVAARMAGLSSCGPAGITACYEGVNGIRTRGVELEVAGEISDRWRITGGYTYAQSERTEGAQAGQAFSTETYPEHILKLFTTYTTTDKRLTIGAGVRAQSKLYYRSTSFNVEQPTYAVADLLAQYQLTEKTLIQLNVNNVFDKTYYSAISYNVASGVRIGAPREFRISLKHEF